MTERTTQEIAQILRDGDAIDKERALNTLSSEFDAAVARMQTPRARAALEAAFNASPARLGKAAVAAATPRDAKPRRAAKT